MRYAPIQPMESEMVANGNDNGGASLCDVLIFGALGPVFGLLYLTEKASHAVKMRALKRRNDKAAAERKAKRQAALAKRKAPKRSVGRKARKIKSARDHRTVYGAPPALRIIPGGKA